MNLPNDSQSILILGKNGTGKSRAAVWHLAQRDFSVMPWIVLNHKKEPYINSIPGAQLVGLNHRVKDPGLYVYQPIAEVDDEAVTNILWSVYHSEGIGVYIDEGYMINPRNPALNALYTQGRSKHVPIITLSQRPSLISRFAISEAAFFQSFYLNDKKDRQRVQEYVPCDFEQLMGAKPGQPRMLPDFHSLYYDTSKNDLCILQPLPTDEEIMAVFRAKLLPSEEVELEQKPLDGIAFI